MKKLSLKELNRVDVATFKAQEKTPVIVVLDNVRSALNVGSAFRTSDAFALEAIYLCGITAHPPHREILKTAIGATESVDWKYFEHTIDAVADLKKNNYQVYAIEQAEGSRKMVNRRKSRATCEQFIDSAKWGVSPAKASMSPGCHVPPSTMWP